MGRRKASCRKPFISLPANGFTIFNPSRTAKSVPQSPENNRGNLFRKIAAFHTPGRLSGNGAGAMPALSRTIHIGRPFTSS